MNIFDYFFQKGHFKGSLKKRAHQQKNFGMGAVGGGVLTTLLPTLLRRACYYLILFSYNFIVFYQFLSISIYFFWQRDIENIHELFISKTNFHICVMLHFIKIWNHIMTCMNDDKEISCKLWCMHCKMTMKRAKLIRLAFLVRTKFYCL